MSLFTLTTQGTTSGTITARAFNAAGTAYAAAQSVSGSHPTFWVARSALSVGDTDTGRVVWYEDGTAIATEEFDATVSSRSNLTAAEVNAEVDTALTDYAPNTTTPPTVGEIRTEMETDGGKLDHLWEMTEDDGGARRLTANAMEEAPTGSGTGPIAFTATVVEQGTSPAVKLENATVKLVEAGGGVAQASGKTDAQGEVELGLNEATYDVVVVKDGFNPVVTQHTVTADAATHAATFEVQRRALPASDTPGFCNCALRALDITGDPKPGAVVRFQMAALPEQDQTGEVWTGGADVTADAQGDIETKLPQLAKVRYAEVDGNIIGAWTVALVPNEDAAELPSVLGIQN